MIEAVGWRDFGTFFARCSELLDAGRRDAAAGDHLDDRAYDVEKASRTFIREHIFPNGCLPSLEVIARAVARHTDMRMVGLEDITAALRRDAAALAARTSSAAATARRARLRRALPAALAAVPVLVRGRLRASGGSATSRSCWASRAGAARSRAAAPVGRDRAARRGGPSRPRDADEQPPPHRRRHRPRPARSPTAVGARRRARAGSRDRWLGPPAMQPPTQVPLRGSASARSRSHGAGRSRRCAGAPVRPWLGRAASPATSPTSPRRPWRAATPARRRRSPRRSRPSAASGAAITAGVARGGRLLAAPPPTIAGARAPCWCCCTRSAPTTACGTPVRRPARARARRDRASTCPASATRRRWTAMLPVRPAPGRRRRRAPRGRARPRAPARAGNSLGGWVALELGAGGRRAVGHGDRARRAVARPLARPGAPVRATWPARRAAGAAAADGSAGRAPRRADGHDRAIPSASRRPPPAPRARLRAAPGFPAANPAMRAGLFGARWTGITVPVTLAWPELDRLVAGRATATDRAQRRAARVRAHADVDDPAAVARLLLEGSASFTSILPVFAPRRGRGRRPRRARCRQRWSRALHLARRASQRADLAARTACCRSPWSRTRKPRMVRRLPIDQRHVARTRAAARWRCTARSCRTAAIRRSGPSRRWPPRGARRRRCRSRRRCRRARRGELLGDRAVLVVEGGVEAELVGQPGDLLGGPALPTTRGALQPGDLADERPTAPGGAGDEHVVALAAAPRRRAARRTR